MGIVLGLTAALLWSLGYGILQRLLGGGVSPWALLGAQAGAVVLMSAPLISWQRAWPSLGHWGWIVVLAVLAIAAQWTTYRALQVSSPLLVSALLLTQPVWLALGALLVGQRMAPPQMLGVALVIAGVGVLLHAQGGTA